ncbi:MAG: hypothetical protein U0271_43575 [Polyangiaceae bacterium]
MVAPSGMQSVERSSQYTPAMSPPGAPPEAEPNPDVLFDPYLNRKPAPPPSKPLSPAALAAMVLSIFPVGSLAAVFVGMSGLRQTSTHTMRGRTLAWTAIVVGALATIGYASAGAIYTSDYIERSRESARKSREEWQEEHKRRQAKEDDDVKVDDAPPPEPTNPARPASIGVPQNTSTTKVGAVTVVELGSSEKQMKAAFVKQLTAAKADGKDIVVMTTNAKSSPCLGFMSSLSDPSMQKAFEKHVLVRVDVIVFQRELSDLNMSPEVTPGFYLLSADGVPRDGIDGGEWDADIPKNIAPVMDPFLHGKLKSRKKPFGGPGTFL